MHTFHSAQASLSGVLPLHSSVGFGLHAYGPTAAFYRSHHLLPFDRSPVYTSLRCCAFCLSSRIVLDRTRPHSVLRTLHEGSCACRSYSVDVTCCWVFAISHTHAILYRHRTASRVTVLLRCRSPGLFVQSVLFTIAHHFLRLGLLGGILHFTYTTGGHFLGRSLPA